ncbi:hypothetical protein GGR39_000280 [Novosphingobium fluoreni]|uniref:Uncharacterized protein n=1 Tax=Novosphingobium fluoreni TaxID=1391222 RepID=A0A7W6C338_9SPHN|nr:hypothetical protein [Novosphingobium fluoreni]KTR84094.1 hypothetical protein NS277_06850 [Novosphingobium barchaimii]MBB3938651.1 hypothetical protein [Novosphingobium fluoreni]
MPNYDALREDGTDNGDKSLVILQSLLCLLREKNLLSRADIEDLCERVETRARESASGPFPCCPTSASAAASEMAKIGTFIGNYYGGKHRRM